MYWNNDYRHKVEEKEAGTTVHELASEARITGTCEYFNGNVLIGPIAEDSLDSLSYYQLKLTYNMHAKYDVAQASSKGYYHPDGTSGELIALMAIFFQARFYNLSSTDGELTGLSIQSRHKKKILRVNTPKHVDEKVFGSSERNFVAFQQFLEIIDNIPEDFHQTIISSASNYNLALREIGIDHEMVFVRLVSAIEAFSNSLVLSKKDDPLATTNLEELVSRLDEDAKNEVLTSLKNRQSRLKFTRFLEKYSTGYFKGGNHKAKHTKIKKFQLESVSKAVYTARSKYLHSGERMYLSQSFPGMKFDTDPSSGMTIGMRKFTEKEKLPNIEFFEGLIRHCILNKITELANEDRELGRSQ